MEYTFRYALKRVLSVFTGDAPKTYEQIFDELSPEVRYFNYAYENSLYRFLIFLADWQLLTRNGEGYILTQRGKEERERL